MKADVLFLGDSHMHALVDGARLLGFEPAGGPIATPELQVRGILSFDPEVGMRMVDVPSLLEISRRYQGLYKRLLVELGGGLAEAGLPVITDIACHLRHIVVRLQGYTFGPSKTQAFITRRAVREMLMEACATHLKIIEWLVMHTPGVCYISPPPRYPHTEEMLDFCEGAVFEAMHAVGARTCSTRWALDEAGKFRSEYATGLFSKNGLPDTSHANAVYGTEAMRRCAEALDLRKPALGLEALPTVQ